MNVMIVSTDRDKIVTCIGAEVKILGDEGYQLLVTSPDGRIHNMGIVENKDTAKKIILDIKGKHTCILDSLASGARISGKASTIMLEEYGVKNFE